MVYGDGYRRRNIKGLYVTTEGNSKSRGGLPEQLS